MVPGDELVTEGSFAVNRGDVHLPNEVSEDEVVRLGAEDSIQFAEAMLREPVRIPALARAFESRRALFGQSRGD